MTSATCNGKKLTKELMETVEFLKTIAEPNRLKILCLLRNGEACVCDIWESVGVTQNLASHHLKELKRVGLVSDRKVGLKVFYSINPKGIAKFRSLLHTFLESCNA